MKTTILRGVELPVDEAGRVDISAYRLAGNRSMKTPAEWAKHAKYRELIGGLCGQNGAPPEEFWKVVGIRKHAHIWAHPKLAEAYLEDVGQIKVGNEELMRYFRDLDSRVASIEEYLMEKMRNED